MKKWLTAFSILTVLGLSTLGLSRAAASAEEWQVDTVHSGVYFVVRHVGIINQHGSFTKCSGTALIDDDDISKSKLTASVETSSINTGVEARDTHLKSPDFFDVVKYPTMTFESTRIWKAGNATKMTGNFTMHGVTKEVTFDVVGPTAPINKLGAVRRGISATTKIDRRDFGISFDDTVGYEVAINLEIDVKKK